MSTAIVWFRRDLRCQDNPALARACRQHTHIIPVYILEENLGGAQQWWLHHSLTSLQATLKQHDLALYLSRKEPLDCLSTLCKQFDVHAVYWNRCYEPQQIGRDTTIKATLKQQGITVQSFNASLLHEPWEIHNKSHQAFKVFTPYWKTCLQQLQLPVESKVEQWPQALSYESDDVASWQLLPTKPNWAKNFSDHWQPGEQGAHEKLKTFIAHDLQDYQQTRDVPELSSTSKLSPHLHFGEISPWQIWDIIGEAKITQPACTASADFFLRELGWREFSYYLLYHFPKLPTDNFKAAFDQFTWHTDEQALKQWQKGLTGFPIVDAGMRELWETGYMHNRVRMIVASFLIKDLLIDWRQGAAWFLDTLVDADLANNSASWQWVAGSGADAAPFFRLFNPILQGEKFDAQGEYIKRWVPELRSVPAKWIHKPWEAPTLPITLGKDYPCPIVDHSEARKIALEKYKKLG